MGRPMDELLVQNREDARREGRGDRARGEFPDLQSGVRQGAVCLSRGTFGKAPRGEDHFEVERGTSLLTPHTRNFGNGSSAPYWSLVLPG
jgi:hypothetical protein